MVIKPIIIAQVMHRKCLLTLQGATYALKCNARGHSSTLKIANKMQIPGQELGWYLHALLATYIVFLKIKSSIFFLKRPISAIKGVCIHGSLPQ
jgi:hypothetical protein